ncbi:hypothetical protein HOY82DRAFT_546079, partial [Tuber indicum]
MPIQLRVTVISLLIPPGTLSPSEVVGGHHALCNTPGNPTRYKPFYTVFSSSQLPRNVLYREVRIYRFLFTKAQYRFLPTVKYLCYFWTSGLKPVVSFLIFIL